MTGKLIYSVSKKCLNIDGLGEKIIKQLYDFKIIANLEDIFLLNSSSFSTLDGFKEKKINNILSSIEKAKGANCYRFISALGIEHIGEVASKRISELFGLNFIDVSKEDLQKIDGFGDEMIGSFIEFINLNKNQIINLINIIKPTQTDKITPIDSIFNNKKVVITGTMSVPRDEIKKLLENLGAKIINSISKKTDFLIAGENAGSKLEKAKNLDIKILTQDDILIYK